MQVNQTITFNFNFVVDGTSYNFGITAPTQTEASEKLHRALTLIAAELKDSSKPKAN